jgi:hypothetical protein
LGPKKQSKTSAAAFPRVAGLKKQSQHPGAALPACGSCSPKKRSEPLAIRGRLPAGDGFEKTKPAPWCNGARPWWLDLKEQSEPLRFAAACLRMTDLENKIIYDRRPFTHEDENGRAPCARSRRKQTIRCAL